MSGIEHEVKQVSKFRNEHKTKDFTKVNPNQTVPCLRQGNILILSYDEILKFLFKTSDRASEIFRHPDNIEEEKLDEWYNTDFCRHMQVILKLGGCDFNLVQKTKKFSSILKKFNQDMHRLELQLSRLKSSYFTGANICPLDLLIYCDIYATLAILPADTLKMSIYPKLSSWY